MADVTALTGAIKRLAVDAVNSESPCAVLFGTVKSENPLQISVDQKLTLTENQLILTRNVTDFETEITVDWKTEEAQLHTHSIKNKKKITVHNKLKTGDVAVLLRLSGGQQYLVLDKAGDM